MAYKAKEVQPTEVEIQNVGKQLSFREIMHDTLDTIVTRMLENHSVGGAVLITLSDQTGPGGRERRFRVSVMDITDGEECGECGGTGMVGGKRDRLEEYPV